MTTEQRNKVIDELLKKCIFIGSKTIKVTEQDVRALKECYLGARIYIRRWSRQGRWSNAWVFLCLSTYTRIRL